MGTEQMIELIKAVSASGITEFEYCSGDTKLVLKTETKLVTEITSKVSLPSATSEIESTPDKNGHWITSPMVGTFYCAPQEDAAPYVTVGDQVKKGQTIGIIETMKLMNELEADRDGTIVEILVENEQVVEFGQLLFRIE